MSDVDFEPLWQHLNELAIARKRDEEIRRVQRPIGKHNHRWTDAEVEEVLAKHDMGKSYGQIGIGLHRSQNSIYQAVHRYKRRQRAMFKSVAEIAK